MHESEIDPTEELGYFLRLLDAAGRPLRADARILDFGCGEGRFVRALAAGGYTDVKGCDFDAVLGGDDRLRQIESPYRLPFDDGTFDVVLSNQVFEHVQDYETALREIRRVLAPGGTSLHLFPPRYGLREPHVFVPFASAIQNRPWLALWASLGIRNQYQEGKPAVEVVCLNEAFLRDQTTYYTRREALRQARRVFPQARLLELEQLAVRASGRARLAYEAACRFPALATAWCETHGRALLLV